MRDGIDFYRGKPKYKSDIELVRPDIIKDDGFIYGSLVVADGKYYICIFATCSHKTFVNNTIATMFEVIPETIGQYIDYIDKNDKRIFEGDIINCVYNGNLNTYVVIWDKDELDFKATNGKEEYGTNFEYLPCCEEIEVIGNIYDNPELLRGSKNNE